MQSWIRNTLAALLLASTLTAAVRADVNTDKTGLAIHGYDPVAYFVSNKPAKGDFQITAEHAGATYRFISDENRQRFLADPDRYSPQYGGYCAFGVAVNAKFTADPEVFQIVDGKLYLNLNPDIARKFNEDLRGNLKKAEQNWPALSK